MIANPLARYRRLSHALLRLRTQHGWSHAQLSEKSTVSTSAISRLENPFAAINRRPNERFVRLLLDALGVARDSARYAEITSYAEVAADGGWWDNPAYSGMGTGQRDAAIIEAGAAEICEYAGLLLPGLVQTADYVEHRFAGAGDVAAIVAGRLRRQQQLVDDGTVYRLLLEEQAVRRWPVPAAVALDQLQRLLALTDRPQVQVRIIPVDAELDGTAPRAPFEHVRYPTANDPSIVLVDNGDDMRIVVDSGVERYSQLHERLRASALSDTDSVEVIRTVAERLAAKI